MTESELFTVMDSNGRNKRLAIRWYEAPDPRGSRSVLREKGQE